MNSLKFNAVTTLIKSLGCTREDKKALLEFLQKDLGISTATVQEKKEDQTLSTSPSPSEYREKQEEKKTQTPISPSSQEYGEKQKFEMLFEDGTTSFYQRRNDLPIAIILSGRGRKFGLYCQTHNCPDGCSHNNAKKHTKILPQIPVYGNWRILCTADCYVMKDHFHALNQQLETVGWRKIVQSRTYGVLASDDYMSGASNWQVWFAIDL